MKSKVGKGVSIIFSAGAWGGFYAHYKGFMFRICLGWFSFTFTPFDIDFILKAFKEFREQQLMEGIKKVAEAIVKQKWEEPKFFYQFPEKPEDFTVTEMAKWAEAMEHYYAIAKYYEEQERGGACSVDRAYRDWLKPQCAKFLQFFYTHTEALKHIDPNRKIGRDVWENYKHFDKEFCDKELLHGEVKDWVLYELWQIVRKENQIEGA